jgi:Mrp family chromosome partitioning ATPase
VLLLDICARRPSVEANLGMSRAAGLGEVFAKRLTLEEAARTTQYPKLFILGPGLNGADVLGKLASRDIVELLEKAEESYEHVIIDTPPVLLMSDAKLLAPVVDGVIVVVGAEVSSLGMVRRGLQELKQIGANVIGVVLNRAKHVPGGYLQKNLDSYYSYAKPARLSPAAEGGDLGKLEELVTEEELPSMILLEDGGGIRPKKEER